MLQANSAQAVRPSKSVETLNGKLVPRLGRLESIDIVRGLVMVFMAIDHTRDYFSSLRFDPESLSQTYYALFFTRWITHFCAPMFFFLAGVGAYLYGSRRTRCGTQPLPLDAWPVAHHRRVHDCRLRMVVCRPIRIPLESSGPWGPRWSSWQRRYDYRFVGWAQQPS